ncbi:CopG family transcriptional regulator [Agrobacterium rhizogenes]|uniref:CopG family ribbon-helix-helix protein n=1 Tax=Rhizobium rhizogenes TaxID=359 RepID=UPI0015741795|nr:CopG family transcriptional regulator [Rhizobium rhizogenes]NTF85641.1 CopG family transcriptional regulator [Rhizobium rhizogenes]
MSSALKASVKIDLEVNERLEKLAASRRRQPDLLLKEAVEQYVDREEKRDSLLRDGRLSLDEYEATGLHVTGDEVIAWLETWGDEDEKAPPECHR